MKRSNKEISNLYKDAAFDIAKMIGKLDEYKNLFDSISNQTMDNADPLCYVQECIERLGVLLSSVTIYSKEYEEDEKDEEKIKK